MEYRTIAGLVKSGERRAKAHADEGGFQEPEKKGGSGIRAAGDKCDAKVRRGTRTAKKLRSGPIICIF